MTLHAYRSIDGLGTRVTGVPVLCHVPWIDDDSTECIRVDWLCYKTGVIKYVVDYDADAGTATLTVHTTAGSNTGSAATLTLDETVTLSYGVYSIKVTRIATGNTGTLTIRPMLVQNNDIMHGDVTDPSGVVTYRCIFLYNFTGASATINTIACSSGLQVSLEGTSAETTQTIADETAAPLALSFSTTVNPAQALANDAYVPLWIKRTASATAGEHVGTITVTYNTTSTVVLSGAYVTKDTSIPPYYLYYAIDATGAGATTIDNADNVATPDPIASLPHTVDIGDIQDAMHGLGTDTFVIRAGVRAVKTTGAQSQNQLLDYALHLDYTSGDITAPNAPVIDTVEYLDGGQVRVVVLHDQAGGTTRAKKLTATIGAETITKLLPADEDVTETEFIFETPVTWGDSIPVSVVAVDANDNNSAAATDTQAAIFEYENSTGVVITNATARINGIMIPASITGAIPTYDDMYITDSWGDVVVTAGAGFALMTLNGTNVFNVRCMPRQRNKISTLALTGGTISAGSYADVIEPVSTTQFYLCAGGSRVAHVNLATGLFTCDRFDIANTTDCPVGEAAKEYNDVVYWQYFDLLTNRWRPYMEVDKTNNCVRFCINVECI